jgi:transcriptional regulator with XRE-family HTH domain
MEATYAAEIRALRTKHDLTQAEVAEGLREDFGLTISEKTYQRWETGQQYPRPRHRRVLAMFFATRSRERV